MKKKHGKNKQRKVNKFRVQYRLSTFALAVWEDVPDQSVNEAVAVLKMKYPGSVITVLSFANIGAH